MGHKHIIKEPLALTSPTSQTLKPAPEQGLEMEFLVSCKRAKRGAEAADRPAQKGVPSPKSWGSNSRERGKQDSWSSPQLLTGVILYACVFGQTTQARAPGIGTPASQGHTQNTHVLGHLGTLLLEAVTWLEASLSV